MRTFMFTVATNGYDFLYRRHLRTQKEYARHQGYTYVAFTRPRKGIGASTSSWLKIGLLLRALRSGYDSVLFVDADCEMRPNALPIDAAFVPEKHVYMANGHSGRVNAGVIIVRNHPSSVALFQTILDNRHRDVPAEDFGPYEAGHVIHYAKTSPILGILDPRWNDWGNCNGRGYIRHWGGTGRRRLARSMRKLYCMFVRDGFSGMPLEDRRSLVALVDYAWKLESA